MLQILRTFSRSVGSSILCTIGLSLSFLCINNTTFANQAVPQDKEFRIVDRLIDDIAAAGMQKGRRVIFVNRARWNELPRAVQQFIYNHEKAHHVLKHLPKHGSAGGFLNPSYSQREEDEADLFAARSFLTKGNATQLKDLLKFLRTIPNTANQKSPQTWRTHDITKAIQTALEQPGVHNDTDAVSFLKEEIFNLADDDSESLEGPTHAAYRIVYRNTGATGLQCVLAMITAYQVNKERIWRPADVDLYTVNFAPYETFVAAGKLEWHTSFHGEGRFFHPDPESRTTFASCTFPAGTPKPPKPQKLDYQTAFKTFVDEISGTEEFKSLRGRLEQERAEYKSLLLLPEMEDCTINLETNAEPKYECGTKHTSDSQQAQKQYETLVAGIRDSLSTDWKITEDIDSEGRKEFEATLKAAEGPSRRIRAWIVSFDLETKPQYFVNFSFVNTWP